MDPIAMIQAGQLQVEPLMTTRQLAQYLQITVRTVDEWVAAGTIPSEAIRRLPNRRKRFIKQVIDAVVLKPNEAD